MIREEIKKQAEIYTDDVSNYNEQMVAVADGAVMFWNGESHGTRHDIELSRKKGIPHVIKMYKINKSE